MNVFIWFVLLFLFFKQKTAYEMRISDWSSDVCSSDLTPTYMLAVVVDDHDMSVSHVIRGDDHLNNAFRQLQLIRAMGWAEPVYAHIPLIHGADGAKLDRKSTRLNSSH